MWHKDLIWYYCSFITLITIRIVNFISKIIKKKKITFFHSSFEFSQGFHWFPWHQQIPNKLVLLVVVVVSLFLLFNFLQFWHFWICSLELFELFLGVFSHSIIWDLCLTPKLMVRWGEASLTVNRRRVGVDREVESGGGRF